MRFEVIAGSITQVEREIPDAVAAGWKMHGGLQLVVLPPKCKGAGLFDGYENPSDNYELWAYQAMLVDEDATE